MEIHFTPKGVCSRGIDIVVEDGIIQSVKFTGGMQRQHPGRGRAGPGDEGAGLYRPLQGHPLRGQVYILPGPAGPRAG